MDNLDEVLQQEVYEKFPEEAIPLVIFNEEKKLFELNEEGRQYLEEIKGPIGIVAVAGMYRTGKSYLLNRMLLDRSDGFGVGPTINPCTKGVWMWGKPVQGLTPEGDPINVIIMDTEGLGALDEDSNHDVRIFSLAILLSSYFIYNSVGSIDENALQNLSLVINLTKHIQIKSSGLQQDDVDPEEYAKYFPTFLWVVRDFTLQLVDAEGEHISPKEYLEKALQNQKGFSDAVEQKNRIRRLLKSFFTDRDCVTMIRPLTNEDKLQNLINIPMEDLRGEFVEQVLILRRKVLQRIKPKKINGKTLNGAMFWNLMKSYVEAINKGAIPSIESSWAYICKNECLKAQDDSFDVFQKALAEELQSGGPFYDQELKDIYNSCKKQALGHFNKIAVGEVRDKYSEDLKEKMKQKFNMIKQDNDQSCEQECVMFLRQSYTEIERALKNQQYGSFIDYLSDMEQFKQIFDESGPPGTHRKEIMLDFCMKAIMESAEFFMANFNNEMNLQRSLAEESIRKLQQEIKDVKGEQKDRIESLETKLRKAEIEKAELGAKEQTQREALQQVQTEKDQLETELNQKISQTKKDYERQMDDIQTKMSNAENQHKEIQRQQVQSQSEFDKNKALLDQKIEFLEKALEDSNRREKELSLELKNSKKEFLNQNKEQTTQLEKQIKDQMKTIDEMKEQIYENENKNTELELQMEEQKNNYEDKILNLSKDAHKLKELDSDLQKKYDSLKKSYDQEFQSQKNNQENEKLLNSQKMKDVESQLKETQDTFEMAKQAWAKEEAVLKQKHEFVVYQLDDEKKKFEEQRQAHESMLKSLQNHNRESVIGREEAQIKINELEQKYMNQRKEQEEQYNEYRKRLSNDIENLKKKNNELELAAKLKDGEYEKSVSLLEERLAEAEEVKDTATRQLKNLDQTKGTMMAQTEERFKQREAELEALVEAKDAEIDQMIEDHNKKSAAKLNDLRRFYDEEKTRLEQRAVDDKARSEKKLAKAIEEYEDRITEMNNNNEDAYNALEEDKNALEQDMQNILNQLEKENNVMQQQIETKDRYLAELKESYNNLQNSSSKQNDFQLEKFNKERRELNERLEQVTAEISKRDRAILSVENQKESLANQIKNKDKQLEELRNDNTTEKSSLQTKLEDVKQKYDGVMDELTQFRISSEREKALKDQKLSFQDQRLTEYQNQMQATIERYEERLKQEKEEASKTLQERMTRVQQEKDGIETKYEQKRKALKQVEKDIQQSQSQFEREKAVQIEKYENLERQQKELIKNYEIENQRLQESNEQLNQALSQGELGIREQVEQWKSQYYEMERAHADLQSELEKEKALWEGKFEFLEKQKEQAKKDNEEALQQFRQTVDQLHKTQNESKNKNDQSHNSIMQQMDAKHKKELKDMAETNTAQMNQLNSTIRRLEKENKTLNERLELSSKSMMSEQGGLEKKIERVQEERDRLKEDIETIKVDRDRKLDEMRRQYEREKDIIKQKNNDLQNKAKNVDGKQTDLILQHETNRAKWDQEKSFLISARDDAVQELKNFQRKYENSVKEIERLKEQQKRNNWRMQNKERIGGVTTQNPMLYKMGEGVLGRLNLGGAGAGLGNRQPGDNLTASQSNFALSKGGEGSMGTYRSNLGGVDKSVDNFKLGFGQKFGSQLGNSGLGLGSLSGGLNAQNNDANKQTFGAVAQPQNLSLGLNLGQGAGGGATAQPQSNAASTGQTTLDNSMRQSNAMSTPSSKGGNALDDDM